LRGRGRAGVGCGSSTGSGVSGCGGRITRGGGAGTVSGCGGSTIVVVRGWRFAQPAAKTSANATVTMAPDGFTEKETSTGILRRVVGERKRQCVAIC
jgi:hypothetical protein